MEVYKLENVMFQYPGRKESALSDINFSVLKGQFVTICGKSGCGKTTLLRLLKSILTPKGEMLGEIFFCGTALTETDAKKQSEKIGFVMQNPDNQIVTDKVWHELAFGLENLGYSQSEIRSKVAETASFFGIQNWFYKNVSELSGGQKQLLNLAAVMTMQPTVIILDEPTSQLDPIAAYEFIKIVERINRELGITVIMTEHRLEEAFSVSDRIVVMDGGKIMADAKPCEIGKILKTMRHTMFEAMPAPVRVYNTLKSDGECPVTVGEGRVWLESFADENELFFENIPDTRKKSQDSKTVVELKNVYFKYEKNSQNVIENLSLSVKKGEIYAILGGNAAGKTTALSIISGLNKPYSGKVLINGTNIEKLKSLYTDILAVLPQNPQSLFIKKSVYLDLVDVFSSAKITDEEKTERINAVLKICEIENLKSCHPYDLSGGEQQRVALAKILLKNPSVLLLDEPTKGMDAKFKAKFGNILYALASRGVVVIIVSHDIEFCAKYADRCAMFFDKGIISEDTPREFFAGKNFYTTSANRMARDVIPKAILSEDIILVCQKEPEHFSNSLETEFTDSNRIAKQDEEEAEETTDKTEKKKVSVKDIIFSLSFILLIVTTVLTGVFFLGGRKYYLISTLVILETFSMFFFSFEKRKPKARELVTVSVLCALAVGGRTAFFMVPQFKPTIAIIIVSAACLGRNIGFLTGATTAFVSNFFFGHGPWTPWQMLAMGSVGFVSGLCFESEIVKKKRLDLCVLGMIMTLIVYGGILNPASVIMYQKTPTLKMIFTAYMTGFPFDVIHAFSTAFFLWFIGEPMIEKLERVKKKYDF